MTTLSLPAQLPLSGYQSVVEAVIQMIASSPELKSLMTSEAGVEKLEQLKASPRTSMLLKVVRYIWSPDKTKEDKKAYAGLIELIIAKKADVKKGEQHPLPLYAEIVRGLPEFMITMVEVRVCFVCQEEVKKTRASTFLKLPIARERSVEACFNLLKQDAGKRGVFQCETCSSSNVRLKVSVAQTGNNIALVLPVVDLQGRVNKQPVKLSASLTIGEKQCYLASVISILGDRSTKGPYVLFARPGFSENM